MSRFAVFCVFVTYFLYTVGSYKHVIMMHGLLGDPSEFDEMLQWIESVHPSTNVTVIDMFDKTSSLFNPMWLQTLKVGTQMQQIMTEHPEGVHLLCYSQGGLLCRAIIQTFDKHNVHNFIALSSPQLGQFGATSDFSHFFPHFLKETIYKLFYTQIGQDRISVANYWNDPHHQDLYLNTTFLPVLNNQSHHNRSQEYKDNFTRLKNVIAIGGPDDGIITPWQSSQFAAYNANETVIDMQHQEWYKKDSFGLKTLDTRKSLHLYTIPGVVHPYWHKNRTIFDCCLEPWLT